MMGAIVLGWIGLALFIGLLCTYRTLMEHNEYALIHLWMVLMYTMWLPIPVVYDRMMNVEQYVIGAIFGTVYLLLLIIGLLLQTGHLVFTLKHQEKEKISNEIAQYMMVTLSHPLEAFANVLRGGWAISLSVAFWQNEALIWSIVMMIWAVGTLYYIAISLDASLVKRFKILERVKPHPLFVNIDTGLFFTVVMSYVTFHQGV